MRVSAEDHDLPADPEVPLQDPPENSDHPRSSRVSWAALVSSAVRRVRPAKLAGLTYGLTQLVLLGWWLAFYPGVMSYDTVTYVWQVSTGNWSSNHSVLYSSLVWLSLQATGQLGLLTLAQTIVAAAGL